MLTFWLKKRGAHDDSAHNFEMGAASTVSDLIKKAASCFGFTPGDARIFSGDGAAVSNRSGLDALDSTATWEFGCFEAVDAPTSQAAALNTAVPSPLHTGAATDLTWTLSKG